MEVKVRGLKELQAQLVNLGSVSGTKAMRGAMFAATKPLLARAKLNTPVRSGALREAIARTYRVGRTGAAIFATNASTFTVSVGPKAKNRTAVALYNLVYKTKRRGIYHGHFQEFGTKTGTPRRDFLRHALEATANECTNLLASELKKRIERVLRSKRPVND